MEGGGDSDEEMDFDSDDNLEGFGNPPPKVNIKDATVGDKSIHDTIEFDDESDSLEPNVGVAGAARVGEDWEVGNLTDLRSSTPPVPPNSPVAGAATLTTDLCDHFDEINIAIGRIGKKGMVTTECFSDDALK